jgi:hypothetical protein
MYRRSDREFGQTSRLHGRRNKYLNHKVGYDTAVKKGGYPKPAGKGKVR